MKASFIATDSRTSTTDKIVLDYYRNIQKKEKEWINDDKEKFKDAFMKAVCLNRIYNDETESTCVVNSLCKKFEGYCKDINRSQTGSSQDTE